MGRLILAVFFGIFITVKTFAAETNAPVIGLLCVTNMPTGKHAVFWFTNYAKADLAVAPLSVEEQQTNGTWISRSFLTNRNHPVNIWRRTWAGMNEQVSPGQGFSFSVPLPTNKQPWRIAFNCVQRVPVTDVVRDVVRQVTATNAAMRSSKGFSGIRYLVTTPVISAQ